MSHSHNLIVGNYICNSKKLLGEGLMCTVYEAKNCNTNKYVALKQISKKSNIDKKLTAQKLKESYDLEITILNKCKQNNHSNVISLLDNFETQEHYNIVLELCDFNLKEYIEKKKDKRLTQDEAVDFLIQIVEGEKCLHEIHYCHRDIKPENILVKDGCIKITDVNLAKYIENMLTTTYSFVGTAFYLAPEVLSKQKYSPYKADIYSLGVVFYEMLYGLLNKKEKQIDFQNKIEKSPIQVNKILKNLILKMVKENPQDRADWSWVSSCMYQYFINTQTKPDTILVISSFYYNAWQEKYQFLNQLIEDLCLLQITDQNIFQSQSGLLIIKLIIKLVEEKILELLNAEKKEDAQFYLEKLQILSVYRGEYLKVVKSWYEDNEKKQILCQSTDLKEEFRYIERTKQFDKHFQCYLACFFNQLKSSNNQQEGEQFKKKLLQLKLLIACDQINEFQQVQMLLSKCKLSQGNNILGFVQYIENIKIVEEYIKALEPVINQILNEE